MTTHPPRPDPHRMRQRVEAALRQEAAVAASEPLPGEPIRELLHELRVHQVELETQNEELRRTQVERDAAQARYADLYDLAPVGYCTVCASGVVIEANQTLVTLLGGTRSALVGRAFTQCIYADDRDAFYLLHKRLFAPPAAPTPQPQTCELRLLGPAGVPFWAQLVVRLDRYPGAQGAGADAHGADLGMGIALTDISARKRAEEALQQSQVQQNVNSAALGAISQGVLVTDPAGQIVSANSALQSITGYREPELLGRHFGILHGSDTDPQTVEAVCTALRRHEPFAAEVLHYRKDGTPFWNELSISPVFGGPGGALTHFVAVVHDITERKRIQTEAQQKERRLSNAEALAEFGSWHWHLPDGASTWSDKLFEIYGRAKSQGVPVFDAWQETIHPDDRDKLARCIQQALASETRYQVEFRIHTKDTGELRYISSRGVSKVDRQGRVTGIWGVDQDITAARRAAQALQAAVQEKEVLLREVHHRVKNNLQVITSLLRLESGRSTQPDTRRLLGDMQARIRTMALLHESLWHAGPLAAVDLGDYLGQVATQVFRAQVVDSHGVRLQLDLASVRVGMDLAMPCGLLVNELVSNSLKHGFPDGGDGEVRVVLEQAQQDPAVLCLRVSDTGVGLPADLDLRRAQTLGLQLVSDLVGQIDGALEIGPGPGAHFIVTFKVEPGVPALRAA